MNELSDKELRSTIVRLVRRSIWNAFENVTSSRFAYWLAVFYIALIFASSLSFCIETLPEYKNGKSENVFYGIELFSVIMFTIEYVLRSLCCPNYRKFVRQPLNVVDVCAILPFYLEAIFPLSVSSLQIIRTIRLVRVLRIVRLGVKFGRLSIIGSSIGECIDMLLVSLAIGSVCTVIFSTLIYYAEHGDYVASLDIYARSTDVVLRRTEPERDIHLSKRRYACEWMHARGEPVQEHPRELLVVHGDIDDSRLWRPRAGDRLG